MPNPPVLESVIARNAAKRNDEAIRPKGRLGKNGYERLAMLRERLLRFARKDGSMNRHRLKHVLQLLPFWAKIA